MGSILWVWRMSARSVPTSSPRSPPKLTNCWPDTSLCRPDQPYLWPSNRVWHSNSWWRRRLLLACWANQLWKSWNRIPFYHHFWIFHDWFGRAVMDRKCGNSFWWHMIGTGWFGLCLARGIPIPVEPSPYQKENHNTRNYCLLRSVNTPPLTSFILRCPPQSSSSESIRWSD